MALPVSGFWSYARADDDAEKGRIVNLAREIQAQYALATGEDLELFVDRDLEWGDDWEDKIDEALAGITFFIPVVTPRWFQRDECRREFLRFFERAEVLGVTELVLPLYYIDVDGFDRDSGDEVVARIARINREDWRDLRLEDFDSALHRKGVARLALRLKKIRETVSERPVLSRGLGGKSEVESPGGTDGTEESESGEEPGMIDRLADMEEAVPRLTEGMDELGRLLVTITEAMQRSGDQIRRSDAAGKGFAGRVVAARTLAKDLDEPGRELMSLASRYSTDLLTASEGYRTLIELLGQASSEEEREVACAMFRQIRELAQSGRELVESMRVSIEGAEDLGRQSRDLRPPLRVIQDGLRRFSDGQAVIEDWIQLMDNSTLDCGK